VQVIMLVGTAVTRELPDIRQYHSRLQSPKIAYATALQTSAPQRGR